MLQPLTKSGERILDGSEIATVFQRAMAALRSGRPRPVQIEISRDIQVELTEWEEEPPPNLPLVSEEPSHRKQRFPPLAGEG